MRKNDPIKTVAEEQVIRASGLLSLLMPQASGVGIGVKGLDGRYQLTNKALEDLLGKSEEQLVDAKDEDLFPPEVVFQLKEADQQVTDGAAAVRIELDILVNGVLRCCQWLKFPMLGADGNILSIGEVVIDASRQEEVAQLRQSLEQLQQTNHQLQNALVELDHLASTDKLTGAWNRRRFDEAVTNEMDRLKRYEHPLSLLIIDIDFFKKVNDLHGHGVGDQVLASLATALKSGLRATDSLTRWGGEEFVVLCPNTTLSTAEKLAERLREKIAGLSFPVAGQITASIGVAECLLQEACEGWLQRADAALYRAKAFGRNQVQLARETSQRLGVGENVAANFVQLAWHKAYECGNTVIDDQHRALFNDANQLLTALLSGRPTDEVAALVDALVHDVVQHFHDEEAIFIAADFPGAAEHVLIHRQLLDRAGVLVGRFQDGTLVLGELFQFLAHDVVARHMLGADREFFSYLAGYSIVRQM